VNYVRQLPGFWPIRTLIRIPLILPVPLPFMRLQVAKILEAFLHNQCIYSSQTLQHAPQPNSVIRKMVAIPCCRISEQTHYTTWFKSLNTIISLTPALKTWKLIYWYPSTELHGTAFHNTVTSVYWHSWDVLTSTVAYLLYNQTQAFPCACTDIWGILSSISARNVGDAAKDGWSQLSPWMKIQQSGSPCGSNINACK